MRGEPTASVRHRVTIFCALPTLLLGITGILLVEYVRSRTADAILPEALAQLRVGQIALLVVFGFVALGFGVLVARWHVRPLRALLGLLEGGGVGQAHEAYLNRPDPVMRRLFQHVLALQQHTRTGEHAMMELATIRRQMDLVRNASGPTRGRLPLSVWSAGTREPAAEGELIREVDRLVRGIRIELEDLHQRVGAVVATLEEAHTRQTQRLARIEDHLAAVEGHGTIWSLEIERLRRVDPSVPGDLGSCFARFTEGIERLRAIHRTDESGAEEVTAATEELRRIHERLEGWVHGGIDAGLDGDLAPSTN